MAFGLDGAVDAVPKSLFSHFLLMGAYPINMLHYESKNLFLRGEPGMIDLHQTIGFHTHRNALCSPAAGDGYLPDPFYFKVTRTQRCNVS